MSALTSFFGGGGVSASNYSSIFKGQIIYFTESQTYTFQQSGTVTIYVIGGGGSGAFCPTQFDAVNSNFSGVMVATGGGAGGTSIKENLEVVAGDTIIVEVGAGGVLNFGPGNAGINNTNASLPPTNGAAGSQSRVYSNNIAEIPLGALNAPRGGGGNGGTAAFSHTAPLTGNTQGGNGGTSQGGDINKVGGPGGDILGNQIGSSWTGNSYVSATHYGSGGGGVWMPGNFSNLGKSGGNITQNTAITENQGMAVASGGGGIGGTATITITAADEFHISGGGGSNGDGSYERGSNNSLSAGGGPGAEIADFPGYNVNPLFSLDAGGWPAYNGPLGGSARSGGGGGGIVDTGGFFTENGGNTTMFGGVGGKAHKGNLNCSNHSFSDSPGYGAGGGGRAISAYQVNNNAVAWSQKGGDGIVIFDFIPD